MNNQDSSLGKEAIKDEKRRIVEILEPVQNAASRYYGLRP